MGGEAMSTALMGLMAEVSLHPGAESTVGVVDLPVSREAYTNYPVITGSSLKGALRARATELWGDNNEQIAAVFGNPNGAGGISVSDARLLLLPVRTLHGGPFKWVTCPYILERFQRDCRMIGINIDMNVPALEKGELLVAHNGADGRDWTHLEELCLDNKLAEETILQVVKNIQLLIGDRLHERTRQRLPGQLVICHDDQFRYFAQYGLQVNARNRLDSNKISQGLWYEETIPPESLFYALARSRMGESEPLKIVASLFTDVPYLQVGGNETIGQGWCAVTWTESDGESHVRES